MNQAQIRRPGQCSDAVRCWRAGGRSRIRTRRRSAGPGSAPTQSGDGGPEVVAAYERLASDFVSGPWFGLYLPQLRMSFDRVLERTLAAEAAGFDSVWLMDHLTAPAAPEVDTLEGWTVASALAARTSKIRIGHLVLCDPFRHAVLLAKMAATLDVISGGRLDLGIGWGSVPAELETLRVRARTAGRARRRSCARRSRSSS